MRDTKLLQAILNKVTELEEGQKKLREEMKDGFKKVNDRLDVQGKQLAIVDDDAPTGADFRKLVKRVDKIEHQLAQA